MTNSLDDDLKGLVVSIMTAGHMERRDLIPGYVDSLNTLILQREAELLAHLKDRISDERDMPDFHSYYVRSDPTGREMGHWERVETFEEIPKELQNMKGAFRRHWNETRFNDGLYSALGVIKAELERRHDG